ncbi:hypothetical protein A1O3_10074 [Capronia epimyces CBS 606.96]|uniref:Zn(2)-C6 fungal-type domain-containing protein n=1 Tax=Capronia epimyces CBS 606.96 TaxID=1182542 RepID=W9X8Y1_9EURO|nr:uncharacterized protein A1O3_10074 [Capronia epimyces CBS 606.96]EXJ76917.1 hypothetical protein A1O3_10074 [Capronia epimyces CBS 606.96]
MDRPRVAATATATATASPTATVTAAARKVQKRAGRACTSCRVRKVRCDVVHCGNPCTNCRLDSLECVVPRSRRHKVSKANKATQNSQPPPPVSVAAVIVPSPEGDTVSEHAVPRRHHAAAAHQERQHHWQFDAHATSTTNNDLQCPASTPALGGHVNTALAAVTEEEHFQHPPHASPSAIAPPSLPTFIKPLPEDLDQADLRYLHEKGAVTLPTVSFRDTCLARYLEFSYPLLPLLEKDQIVSIIMSRDHPTSQPISLLLFQAVLCSGVAFVETQSVINEGFASKQEARGAFFHRAKILFNCNVEQDRLVAVQAALLLSTWYPGKYEKMDSWYWVGAAISLAYSIGLHLEPDSSRFDRRDQHLRRRLWWCIFVREHKIALALGRPARITYHNVAMLTPHDFEDDGETDATTEATVHLPAEAMRRHSRAVLDGRTMQEALARLCIEHTKLCVCIARFVSTIFDCRRQVETGDPGDQDRHPLPSPSSRLKYCIHDFARWYRQVPADLRYDARAATFCPANHQPQPEEQCRSLIVHKATVHTSYYVAISALYRLKALSPSSTWRERNGAESHGLSQRILRHAAWELTSVNQDLCEAGLSRYLSTSAVGSVVAAVVIHLLDMKAPNEAVRRAAVQGIQQCEQFLLILQESYGTATDALEYLREAAWHEADLSVPEQDRECQPRQQHHQHQHHHHNHHHHHQHQAPTSQMVWRSSPPQAAPVPAPTLAGAAEIQPVSSVLQTPPPPPETDEMMWQSYIDGTPSYDLFAGFSLPHFDLGVSPNDSGGFNLADVFPES